MGVLFQLQTEKPVKPTYELLFNEVSQVLEGPMPIELIKVVMFPTVVPLDADMIGTLVRLRVVAPF